ncbi:hypothetical protein EWM64_g9273 [Hericium alpestre]|uniref:Uncharacterized protein n=1 Tax=Hericium alpestre TaxID=135208 RepID=A0A4Y9ZMS2_9AGAM|nr:hypothetical protein EWM64_g9273 [Hericium alpestre]
MSLLDHFSLLDELIQVIYQGSARFVIISTLDHSRKDPSWRIRLGLAREGRWWQGRWTEDDVLQVTGNKSSPDVLEAFGDRLAGAVTKGDLRVDGYEPRAANEELKLVIGSTARKPLYMSLNRMSPEDAAQFAADQFLAIALQARSHGCQIYPSTYAPSTPAIPERTTPRKRRTPSKRTRAASVTESSASDAEALPFRKKEALRVKGHRKNRTEAIAELAERLPSHLQVYEAPSVKHIRQAIVHIDEQTAHIGRLENESIQSRAAQAQFAFESRDLRSRNETLMGENKYLRCVIVEKDQRIGQLEGGQAWR